MEATTNTVPCPECEAVVPIADDTLLNEIIPCAECGADLEITGLDPLTIEVAPEIEEDWGE